MHTGQAGAAASKSAQISALVQQLKAGQITKAELFEKLQQLQRREASAASGLTAAAADASATNGASSAQGSNGWNDSQNGVIQPAMSAYAQLAATATAGLPAASAAPPSVPSATGGASAASNMSQIQSAQAAFSAALAAASAQLPANVGTSLPATVSLAPGQSIPLQHYLQQQQALMVAALAEVQKQGLTMPGAVPPVLPIPVPVPVPTSSSVNAPSNWPAGYSYQQQQQQQQQYQPTDATLNSSTATWARATSASRASRRSSNQQQQQQQQGGPSSSSSRARSARKSIVGSGEMEECTFKPRVNPLPPQYSGSSQQNGNSSRNFADSSNNNSSSSYYNGNNNNNISQQQQQDPAAFQERVTAWERAKRNEVRRQAIERQQAELEECTFQPRINPTSREVARARGHRGEEIHERLYRQAQPVAAKRPGTEGSSSGGGGGGVNGGVTTLLDGGLQFAYNADGTVSHLLNGSSSAHPFSNTRGGNGSSSVSPTRGSHNPRLSLLSTGRPLFTSTETGSPSAPLDRIKIAEAAAAAAEVSAAAAASRSGAARRGSSGYYAQHPNAGMMSSSGLGTHDAADLAECTFQPRVNPVLDARPVRSRYRDPTPTRSASRPKPLPTGVDQCTFQPKTNPVRPNAMPAAAVYVQAPIYDRLARTQTRSQREREKQVQDELLARSHQQHAGSGTVEGGGEDAGGDEGRQRSSSADRSSVGNGGGGAASMTSEEKEERARRMQDFLNRQEAALQKREATVEALKAATAPTLQPALCEKSLRIVNEKGLGGFLDRVTRDKIIKEQERNKDAIAASRDPECTFNPAINPSSRTMKARSVTEMSRGDALKRETTARVLRLKNEQDTVLANSFEPRINERSRRMEGRLRILSDPDSYVARLSQEAAAQAQKAREAAALEQAQEFAECTFHPAVHPAPQYVSMIAQSMALTRSAKSQPPPARPDWR